MLLLNPFLFEELKAVCGNELDVHCFGDWLEGLQDFSKNAGVTAKALPNEQETSEIKKEIADLPPMGWLSSHHNVQMRPYWHPAALTSGGDEGWLAYAASQGVPQGETPIALRESAPKSEPESER
jgi:hypothetical protein